MARDSHRMSAQVDRFVSVRTRRLYRSSRGRLDGERDRARLGGQIDEARAVGRDERNERRYQRRFEESGLAVLGRLGRSGGPATPGSRARRVSQLRREDKSMWQIVELIGVFREGHPQATPALELASGQGDASRAAAACGPNLSGSATTAEESVATPASGADLTCPDRRALPTMSRWWVSADRGPADRLLDRLLAKLGLLDDAASWFRASERVEFRAPAC